MASLTPRDARRAAAAAAAAEKAAASAARRAARVSQPNLVVDPAGPSSNNLVVDPTPNMRTAAGISGNAGMFVDKLYNTY